tara:strand:+ start:11438 stop:12379 length:942 start_codon:yes stop_codon:yes gene_type:complete
MILITGGLGYLGGRIAVDLLASNKKVRIGTRRSGMKKPDFLPDCEMVQMDMENTSSLVNACEGVDSVIHLAAMNADACLKDPERAFIINVLGVAKLLEAAQKKGVKRFIYFSTAHVYGNPLIGDISERSLPRPSHPYSKTHHMAEEFVLATRDKGLILGIVLRLSNVIGPPANIASDCWSLLVNELCQQAVNDRKLTLRSNGLQTRDFITISDTVRATVHFLNLPESLCEDGLFNVGGENVMSILEMAQRVATCCERTLGYLPEIICPDPSLEEEIKKLRYEIMKLKGTGFSITGDLNFEINQTLNSIQNRQK